LPLVKDQHSWEAYGILLYEVWYTGAYEYLFGSVQIRPVSGEAMELARRLHRRLNHWHKKASEALAGKNDSRTRRFAVEKTEETASITERSRKADATLLADKSLVTFRTAEKYLGISERQRQSLIERGILVVKGKGHNRRITTDSLLEYLPAENPK
jgi:hypothetical protein